MTETQAMYWAAYYNAEIKALPENNVVVTEAFESTDLNFVGTDQSKTQTITGKGEIAIPDGYLGTGGAFDLQFYGEGFGGTRHLALFIGSNSFVYDYKKINISSVNGIANKGDNFSLHNKVLGAVKYSFLAAKDLCYSVQ